MKVLLEHPYSSDKTWGLITKRLSEITSKTGSRNIYLNRSMTEAQKMVKCVNLNKNQAKQNFLICRATELNLESLP